LTPANSAAALEAEKVLPAPKRSPCHFSAQVMEVVLTVKSDETEHWIDYAKQTGRENDLVIFNAASDLSFGPLAYCWTARGKTRRTHRNGRRDVHNPDGRGQGSRTRQRVFRTGGRRAVASRPCCSLECQRSDLHIHQLISSLPTDKEQIEDPKWQESSACGRVSRSSATDKTLLRSRNGMTLKWPSCTSLRNS